MFGFKRSALVIDLGSSHVAVARPGEIPLFRERSRAAYSFRNATLGANTPSFSSGQLVKVGAQAEHEALQRPQTIRLSAPVTAGRLKDPFVATQLLDRLLRAHHLINLQTRFFGGTVMLLVPPDVSAAELQAWLKVGEDLNCGRVRTLDTLIAAVTELGLDIREPRGQMVVDIGGGCTRAAIFSLGEMAALACAPVGGETLDRAIQEYMHHRYRLNLGREQAESIRISLGSVFPKAKPEFLEFSGVDFSTGIVKKVTLDDNEIRDVLLNVCEPIVATIKQAFEQAPTELTGDVARQGVVLIGGGALLSGLTSFLEERTGVPFRLAEASDDVALRGAIRLLNPSQMAKSP